MRNSGTRTPPHDDPSNERWTGSRQCPAALETSLPASWIRQLLGARQRACAANTLPSIVVIEDDGDIARGLVFSLSSAYRVEAVQSGSQALELLSGTDPNLLLVDFQLPDTNGIALMSELRARGSRSPAIMISAFEAQREASLRAGFDQFIAKPWENGELIWHIEHSLSHRN